MATPGPNLFHRLHKWAHRQDENFLKESFAVVLEQLLVLAPVVGTRLVSKLTGGFIHLPPEDASLIGIETQVEAGTGRPDLQLRAPDKLVWVEVKVEAGLGASQLERHRKLLQQSGAAHTRLVLLTRYPQSFLAGAELPDVQLRWFQIAEWFENELPTADAVSGAAGFVARQFMNFLEKRSMALAQVGKYMPEGVRAMCDLMNMLIEAARTCKVSFKERIAWEFMGIYLDQEKYWIGIEFAAPGKLCFSTGVQVDPVAVAKLGVGRVYEEKWAPGVPVWCMDVELDSEEVHFFSRSKLSQMQWLEKFIRERIENARLIEIPT